MSVKHRDKKGKTIIREQQAVKYADERERDDTPVWEGNGGLSGWQDDGTLTYLASRFRHANRHRQAILDLMI